MLAFLLHSCRLCSQQLAPTRLPPSAHEEPSVSRVCPPSTLKATPGETGGQYRLTLHSVACRMGRELPAHGTRVRRRTGSPGAGLLSSSHQPQTLLSSQASQNLVVWVSHALASCQRPPSTGPELAQGTKELCWWSLGRRPQLAPEGSGPDQHWQEITGSLRYQRDH